MKTTQKSYPFCWNFPGHRVFCRFKWLNWKVGMQELMFEILIGCSFLRVMNLMAHLVHDRCPNRTYWLLDENDQKRIGSIAYKSMIKTSQFFNFNLDFHLHPLLEMGPYLSGVIKVSASFSNVSYLQVAFILASSFLLSSLSVNEQRTKPCLLGVLSEKILPSYMRYGQNPVTVGE